MGMYIGRWYVYGSKWPWHALVSPADSNQMDTPHIRNITLGNLVNYWGQSIVWKQYSQFI